jgi:imidazolonepropionase-like amidohydrolase
LSADEILGISDRVGSLEVGKDATFVVSAGDALDMRTSLVTDAYIQCKQASLRNKQKDLYDKYLQKFGIK